MRKASFLLAALAPFILSGLPALGDSPCAERIGVGQGETMESLARRCGVNAEALKQANPGSHIRQPHAGTFMAVPAPSLPSPTTGGRGNPAISSAPPPALSRDRGIALRKTYPGTLADQPRPQKPPSPPPGGTNKPWEPPRPLWAPPEPPFH